MIHQPLEAEPSPPTLSLPTKLAPLHTEDMNRNSVSSFMPFSAASRMIWGHCGATESS